MIKNNGEKGSQGTGMIIFNTTDQVSCLGKIKWENFFNK